ncbi:MAG: VWA domain-containing protein [Deltaproteobacteria bacterium]|nr:VWA domain-containing protein [Deltaproteobacteria bacterium]
MSKYSRTALLAALAALLACSCARKKADEAPGMPAAGPAVAAAPAAPASPPSQAEAERLTAGRTAPATPGDPRRREAAPSPDQPPAEPAAPTGVVGPSPQPTTTAESAVGGTSATETTRDLALDQGSPLSDRLHGTEARHAEGGEDSANGYDEQHGQGRRGARDNDEAVRPPPEPRRELVRSFYLSNDDSMSLSSAQRIEYAIEKGLAVPRAHIRPHELLNYYSFETAPVDPGQTFSVKADISAGESGGYTLAIAVRGRSVSREERTPLVLTLVLDVSGSMRDEGKMEFLQQGLLAMLDQLKPGDVVNLVTFNQNAKTILDDFEITDDSPTRLRRAIEGLQPGGATDLHEGLTLGYGLAEKSLDPEKNNRVLLVTDALTNTGTTDERLIAEVGRRYDDQKIRLSGIGVGADFNDELLDRLTERGKGAYVFVGSESVVDRVFKDGFTSLVETIASDVRFRLDLPASLALERFYGEEASTDRSRVQAIHYFAGTSQLFLSDLALADREPEASDEVKLTIEFEDPSTGTATEKTFAFRVGDILADPTRNVLKARLLMAWARHLSQLADHQDTTDREQAAKVEDQCREAQSDLESRARSLSGDADVSRIRELMDMFCARFEGAGPTRHNDYPPEE